MKKEVKKCEAIKCLNCRRSSDPFGMPIVVTCSVLNRKLVGEALRRCQFYEAKGNVRQNDNKGKN